MGSFLTRHEYKSGLNSLSLQRALQIADQRIKAITKAPVRMSRTTAMVIKTAPVRLSKAYGPAGLRAL